MAERKEADECPTGCRYGEPKRRWGYPIVDEKGRPTGEVLYTSKSPEEIRGKGEKK